MFNAKPPARPEHIIRYMLGRKLDFDPGQNYKYSNFGYCLLGRVIGRCLQKAPDDRYQSAGDIVNELPKTRP